MEGNTYDGNEKSQKNYEVAKLDEIPCPGHDQAVLVQQRCPPRVVQRDWSLLPMVRDDIHETVWRVDEFSSVDCIDDLLTSTASQKTLACADNGDFEGGEFPLDLAALSLGSPMHGMDALLADLFGSALKGLETRHEDVGKFQESSGAGVLFVIPTQNLFGNKFAQQRSRQVDGLMVRSKGLFTDELHPVNKQTVNY